MEKLFEYLQLAFVQRAMIVGPLIALCSSLLGIILVLRRFSFISHGLSNVAFCIMTVASVVGLTNNMFIVMPVTALTTIVLLRRSSRNKSGDASIAMISVLTLSLGYLIINMFSESANVSGDVCTVLFGSMSILTLSNTDVWICIVLSIIVVVMFTLLYNKILGITFDSEFCRVAGINTSIYQDTIAIMVAIVIVLAMNLVGSLLVSALIVFPAISAMRVCRSFKSVTVVTVILAVFCAVGGLVASIIAGTPVGATIVVADAIVFVACCVLGIVRK